MKHILALLFLLLSSVSVHAANYVLESNTSSYGYGSVNSPAGEQFQKAVDGSTATKYLNFFKTGGGITLGFDTARIMRRLVMSTANDAAERDPMTINIYGSSTWDGAKTLIQSNVATNLSTNRFTASTIDFENNISYQFYSIEVTSVRNSYANSFQFSEVAFYYDTQYIANATPTYSSGITIQQSSRKSSAEIRQTAVTNNSIHIEQIGDNNTINVTQSSNNNQLKGVGQDRAYFDGNNNNITIRQGSQLGSSAGKNLMEVSATGDSNTLNLNQGVSANGSATADSNNHYQMLNLTGSNNTVTKVQTDSTANATGHFMETTISGSSNVVDLKQNNSGSKVMFTNINGSNNSVTANQKDSGQHYLETKLIGNGHNVGVTQEGAGNHKATIDLTNGGGSSTVNLLQSGTNNQTYSIQQSCAIASGCSTSITQNQ